MTAEIPRPVPEEVKRGTRNTLKGVGTVLGVGVLSIAGLVAASADQPVCEGESDALAPFLEVITSNELEGRTEDFSGTDKDLSPALQQALKEHFQKSAKEGVGCIIEIGQSDKN